MTKLITGIALLAGVVLFLLSDSKLADAHGDELALHVALPVASGGTQLIQVNTRRGQSLTATNLDPGTLPGRLDAHAYRIEGHWVSDRTLRLDVYVATTIAFQDRLGTTQWTPERELVRHALEVQPQQAALTTIPEQPAPGGVPRATLLHHAETPRG